MLDTKRSGKTEKKTPFILSQKAAGLKALGFAAFDIDIGEQN